MNISHASSSVAALLTLSACGAGTAAAVSGGGDESGGNAAATIASFAVLDAQEPALCRVEFVVRDAEGDPTEVELLYVVPGEPEQRITHIAPIAGVPAPPSNPGSLASSAKGVQYAFQWDFAAEALLPDDGGFVEGARVIARLDGGSVLAPSSNAHFGIGNDPPVILDARQPKEAEVAGIAAVPFTVADSSSDAVSIQVEYDVVGDLPDAGWRIARPAGLPAGASTPEFAFTGVIAPAELGVELVFFWNTNVDLHDLEHDVMLRFTPRDGVKVGEALPTPVFHVDNNDAPIAEINDVALVLSPDQRRGIPVQFRVTDPESDEIAVVFQWRRPTEPFLELPGEPAALQAIAADPRLRAQNQVCSEYPTYVQGCVAPMDATHVRLPELASSASTILAHGVVGRDLEILRASSVPTPVASAWAVNPLVRPVAAFPLGAGLDAIVLDSPSAGAWRLQRVTLATGEAVAAIATGVDDPSAMDFVDGESHVLIASDRGGAWRLSRVSLATGVVETLFTADGSTESGRVRALAAVGTQAALLTVGSSLVRADWSDPQSARAATILSGLATPWGIALDPLDPDRAYVAERDAALDDGEGRILAVDLDARMARPIRARLAALLDDVYSRPFNRPEALAFERSGKRLIAITHREPSDGTYELEGIDLGGADEGDAFVISSGSTSTPTSIVAGPERLLLLAAPESDELLVGGGLQQRATIEAYDPSTQAARLAAPFEATIAAGQPWRIQNPSGREHVRAGAASVFVWDSGDVRDARDVILRAIPMDAERGVESVAGGTKRVRHAWDVDALTLATPVGSDALASADVDGDGDLDLVAANYYDDSLSVFLQSSPRTFAGPPLMLGGAGTTGGPEFVIAPDLDGDGDADIVSANGTSHTLTVYFQVQPGTFASTPLTLGGHPTTVTPWCVAAADIDGDQDLDLVSANHDSFTLTVFFQTGPGVFSNAPLTVGGFATMRGPTHVVAADLDGDADVDLACSNEIDDTLTVFLQTSSGVFSSAPQILGGPTVTPDPWSLVAADLDGDGDLDLASANAAGSRLTVFFQTSTGLYSNDPRTFGDFTVTGTPSSIAAADLDRDGDVDLASANSFNHTLTVFLQDSPGAFSAVPHAVGDQQTTSRPGCIALADIDGDGSLDIASANNGDGFIPGGLAVFFQVEPGTFSSAPTSLGDELSTPMPWAVSAADLDGDGDLDLASTSGLLHRVSVFFQTAPGSFTIAPWTLGAFNVLINPIALAAADLDGDADIDLLVGDALKPLSIYFQTSPGTFAPTSLALDAGGAPIGSVRGVATADMDGDGDLDVVSAHMESGVLAIHLQTSPGVFSDRPWLLGGTAATDGPTSVAPADLDGDGDVDLAVSNFSSDTLAVFFQTSRGVFAGPQRFGASTMVGPISVTAADLNGDGKLDLASANATSHTLTVYFQLGAGQFETSPRTLGGPATLNYPWTVTAVDVDRDGALDLAAANEIGDALTVFRQTSPGVFASQPLVLGGTATTDQPFGVIAADLDGDGDVDVASPNVQSDTLTIFWGGH